MTQNSSIPYVGGYLNIVCALVNAYGKPSNIGTSNENSWAIQMVLLRDKQNMLQHRLEEMNMSKTKATWKKYDARTMNFPVLSVQNVQNICLGKYLLMMNRNI